jgi:hypothetical protein
MKSALTPYQTRRYGGTFVGIDHAGSALSTNFARDDENPGEYVNLSEMKP